MASHQKTYLLSPNWDYPSSLLPLGSLLSSPLRPTRSLNYPSKGIPPIPPSLISTTTKENFSLTRSQLYSTHLGIWATFLQVVGVGGDLSIHKASDVEEEYKCETLETSFFQPDKKYLWEALQNEEVKAYIGETLFKKPVWMIIGVKVARGFSVSTASKKALGGRAKVGVDLTPTGMPVQFGPKIKALVRKSEKVRFRGSSDVVFAYRVVRIKRRGKDAPSAEDWNRGALLHDEGEEKAHGVEEFEDNWEVSDADIGMGELGGLEEHTLYDEVGDA